MDWLVPEFEELVFRMKVYSNATRIAVTVSSSLHDSTAVVCSQSNYGHARGLLLRVLHLHATRGVPFFLFSAAVVKASVFEACFGNS